MIQRVTYVQCNTIRERSRSDSTDRHTPCQYRGCTKTLWANDADRDTARLYANSGHTVQYICHTHAGEIKAGHLRDPKAIVIDVDHEVGTELALALATTFNTQAVELAKDDRPALHIMRRDVKLRSGWVTSRRSALSYYQRFIRPQRGDHHSVDYYGKEGTGSIVVIDREPDEENHPYDWVEVFIDTDTDTEDCDLYLIENLPVSSLTRLLATADRHELRRVVIELGGAPMENER